MKKAQFPMDGRIKIQLTGKRNEYVYFELDEIGCQFLMDELSELLNHKKQCVECDPSTGYDRGILTEDSLGFVIFRYT